MTYYEILGVERNTTQMQIKKAYKQKALRYHPDKALIKDDAKIKAINQAYEVLSDPVNRKAYDSNLQEEKPFVNELMLAEDPNHYDYYTYYNKLFGLSADKAIDHETTLSREQGDTYIKFAISYIKRLIYGTYSTDKPSKKLNANREKHIERLTLIGRRIFNVDQLLFPADKGKKLYDISLDRPLNQTDSDMIASLGGLEILKKAIALYPDMYFAPAVFTLHKANCLNLKNFLHIPPMKIDAACISIILDKMLEAKILTQDNFEFLLKYMGKGDITLKIRLGIVVLAECGGLDQHTFELVVLAGERGEDLGIALEALHKFKLLNKENEQVILKKSRLLAPCLNQHLKEMETAGDLALKELCLWPGPNELGNLVPSLNQMFAHGISLLDSAPAEGKQAMILALSLKKELKTFCERPESKKTLQDKTDFAFQFTTQLHSKDHVMLADRALWQVILANTLISFTGFGLFAVIGNLIVNHHGFFAKKKADFMEVLEEKEMLLSELRPLGSGTFCT